MTSYFEFAEDASRYFKYVFREGNKTRNKTRNKTLAKELCHIPLDHDEK